MDEQASRLTIGWLCHFKDVLLRCMRRKLRREMREVAVVQRVLESAKFQAVQFFTRQFAQEIPSLDTGASPYNAPPSARDSKPRSLPLNDAASALQDAFSPASAERGAPFSSV